MKAWKLSLSLVCLLSLASLAPASEVMEYLQAITVVVEAKGAEGTGTLFTRRVDGENRTYVWTAAHVVDRLRKPHTYVDPDTGDPRLEIEYDTAEIVQDVVKNGTKVSEVRLSARLIRYSSCERGHDLALLEICKRNVTNLSTEFHRGDKIPSIGTPVIHVGNLAGEYSNSTTVGILSALGRVLLWNGENPQVFDQTTALTAGGSSGGGMFLRDGRYIGMVQRASDRVPVNFICPVRRMWKWACEAGVQWAMDPDAPMPSDRELAAMPVEG